MYNQQQNQQAGYQGMKNAYQPAGYVQSQYGSAQGQASMGGQAAQGMSAQQAQNPSQFHTANYVGNQAPYNTNQYEQAMISGPQGYQQGAQMQQQANQFHQSNYAGNQPGYNTNQYKQPTATGNSYSAQAGQGYQAQAGQGYQAAQAQPQAQQAGQFHMSNYVGNKPGYNTNQYYQPASTMNQSTAAPAQGYQAQAGQGYQAQAAQHSQAFHQANYQGNQQY
ncbi:hypothetical protein [Marinicrinis sediminis]|uniref:Uncharacterized protein n=1 Tax=Marinicrinis sediminis TaxID=1652465 RepID=A0ABW5R760_9BACL